MIVEIILEDHIISMTEFINFSSIRRYMISLNIVQNQIQAYQPFYVLASSRVSEKTGLLKGIKYLL
jgi:hypothetical protein